MNRVMRSVAGSMANISPRDRRAIKALAWFALAVALWMGLWQPVQRLRMSSEAKLQEARADLEWMRQYAPMAATLAADPPEAALSGSLLATVSERAEAHRIPLSRAEPSGADTLRVTVDNAGFGDLLAWLEALRALSITVEQLSIDPQGEPGRVSATMALIAP